MSTAASNAIAGLLSTFYPHDGEVKYFLGYQVATLSDFFMIFVFMGGVAGIVMLLACPLLIRMMK